MAKKRVWAWVCEYDDCGHLWLATNGKPPPEQCAKCRRRKWHTAPVRVQVQNNSTGSSATVIKARFRDVGKCPHGWMNWMVCAANHGGC